MFRKMIVTAVLVVTGLVLLPGAAAAQQSVALNVGYFTLRGEDSRVDDDALVQNLNYHIFDLKDFNGAAVGGEWLLPVGQFLEVGVGVGFYQRTVPSVYRDFVNEDGTEIEQDFKLRIVPVTGIIRFIPTGRRAAIQPYVGAGIGVFSWRYTETGDFIDENADIFRDSFRDSGAAVGPVIVGGVRVPINTAFALGGEIRYQRAEGSLNSDFNGSKIDLGGITYQANFVFRF